MKTPALLPEQQGETFTLGIIVSHGGRPWIEAVGHFPTIRNTVARGAEFLGVETEDVFLDDGQAGVRRIEITRVDGGVEAVGDFPGIVDAVVR